MEKEFVAYEYKDILISKKFSNLYLDCIENLGWEIVNKEKNFSKIKLSLKRKYNYKEKAKLNELELKFTNSFNELEMINETYQNKGLITSLTIGLIGTCFMAGATFSFLGGLFLLMVVLAIPGFLGWIFPYFINKNINEKQLRKVNQRSEELRQEIYEVIEQAYRLIN